ncbi:MAG TPA: hypothetical protein VI278_08745 [Nitrososphaeraceae archaeon]
MIKTDIFTSYNSHSTLVGESIYNIFKSSSTTVVAHEGFSNDYRSNSSFREINLDPTKWK